MWKIVLTDLNYFRLAIIFSYFFTIIAAVSPLGSSEEGLSLVLAYPPVVAVAFMHIRRSRAKSDLLLARLPQSIGLLNLARLTTALVIVVGGLAIILAITLFTSVLAPSSEYWLGYLYLVNLSLFATGYIFIATDVRHCFKDAAYRIALSLLVLVTTVQIVLLIANRIVASALKYWISEAAAEAFMQPLFSWPVQSTLLVVELALLVVAWRLFTMRLNYVK